MTTSTLSNSPCRRLVLLLICAVGGLNNIVQSRSSPIGVTGINVLIDNEGKLQRVDKNSNFTNPYLALSVEEMEMERRERAKRMRERRERARKILQESGVPPPNMQNLERVDDPHFLRKLSWFTSSDGYTSDKMADSSVTYDKWAQGYRMLGGMIDCDHDKDQGSGGGDKNKNNNKQSKDGACSRWMLWAAYVNPNYQGNEYAEYFGDEPTSTLDCHQPDTEWVLLGVYRQEFYQYIEQISKHLWAIDEYEYVVALAGLKYMTKSDCFLVGYSSSGKEIYAGVAPQPYGKFEMALYTDDYCLTPDTSLGMTYDDFGLQSDIYLGSKDKTDDNSYSWAYDWWYNTQEYTLTQLNDVYEEYKYCTSCVDYPTYQDGYVIGDDGTEDGNLINQCWKFYSHDSYTCEADCIAMAHAQGTILPITYGDTTFGSAPSTFYDQSASSVAASASASASSSYRDTSSAAAESPFQRLLANAALTAAFLLFVATFLTFAVARRTRFRESRNVRSRRLLDDDDDGRVSKSRSRGGRSRMEEDEDDEGDGVYRSSRSKSANRGGSSKGGKERSSSSRKSRSSSRKKRSRSYEPPKEAVTPKSKSSTRVEEYF